MPWPKRIVRDGIVYTICPYPKGLKNPLRLSVIIRREGRICGAAKTHGQAVERIRLGLYDRQQVTDDGATKERPYESEHDDV